MSAAMGGEAAARSKALEFEQHLEQQALPQTESGTEGTTKSGD